MSTLTKFGFNQARCGVVAGGFTSLYFVIILLLWLDIAIGKSQITSGTRRKCREGRERHYFKRDDMGYT